MHLLLLILLLLLPALSHPITATPTPSPTISPTPSPTPTPNRNHKTAHATFHHIQSFWGSLVFSQWAEHAPVIISALIQNLPPPYPILIEIRSNPVNYYLAPSHRCDPDKLGPVLTTAQGVVGRMTNRNLKPRLITSSRFSDVLYAQHLSLFPGENNILGRSVVLHLRSGSVCETIFDAKHASLRPGAVPCERAEYPDCLIATGQLGKCAFTKCQGYRRYWGLLKAGQMMCQQIFQKYPTLKNEGVKREGIVDCVMGRNGLLVPIAV